MHISSLILAYFAATTCSAALVACESPMEGYEVDDIQWEFPTANGDVVKLNGTVEQAVHELGKSFPDVDPFLSEEQLQARDKLAKRTNFNGLPFNCNFPKCWSVGVVEGIQYLRSLNGRPSAGPGPGKCGRVSCAYDNAIWWCNDARQSKTLQSFSSIADGAQYILSKCTQKNGAIAGQAFHPTEWNVIVRSSNC